MSSCACGAAISPKTKSGRCVRCAARDPAVRAKKGNLTPEQRAARAAHAKALSADPVVVAKRTAAVRSAMTDDGARTRHAQACREAMARAKADPEKRARMSEAGRRVGALNLARGQTPEARERARMTIKRRHLAWCPEEHWPLNTSLKAKGFKLEERKAIILAEVEGTAEHARRTVENHRIAAELRHARDLASRY